MVRRASCLRTALKSLLATSRAGMCRSLCERECVSASVICVLSTSRGPGQHRGRISPPREGSQLSQRGSTTCPRPQ